MNNFTMKTFNSGEAFDNPHAELARILRELADRIENTDHQDGKFFLHDLNGNRCGEAGFDFEAED